MSPTEARWYGGVTIYSRVSLTEGLDILRFPLHLFLQGFNVRTGFGERGGGVLFLVSQN